MSDAVHKLHPVDDSAAASAAALGFSMQVDLGAGRVCTLQTFLPNDCSELELNRMLFKMTHAGDCQRAHYQIEGLERDLQKLEKEQQQGVTDLEAINAGFAAEQKARAEEVVRNNKTIANYQAAHDSAATARGTRDPARIKSAEKANIDKLELRNSKLQAEIEVTPEARMNTVRQAQIVLDNRAALIAKLHTEITRNRQIVADGLKG